MDGIRPRPRAIEPPRIDRGRVAAAVVTLAFHVGAVMLLVSIRDRLDERPRSDAVGAPGLALVDLASSASAAGSAGVASSASAADSAGRVGVEQARPPPRPRAPLRRRNPPTPVATTAFDDLRMSVEFDHRARIEIAAASHGSSKGEGPKATCGGAACDPRGAGAGGNLGTSVGDFAGDDIVGDATRRRGKGRYKAIDYLGVPLLPQRTHTPPQCRYGNGCVLYLRVFVAADGTRGTMYMLQGSGSKRYDEVILGYAQDWKFRPRRIDGRPVGGWAVVPVIAAR